MLDDIHQKHYLSMDEHFTAYRERCAKIGDEAKINLKKSAGNPQLLQEIVDNEKKLLDEAYVDLKNAIDHSQKAFFVDIENSSRAKDESELASMEKLLTDS